MKVPGLLGPVPGPAERLLRLDAVELCWEVMHLLKFGRLDPDMAAALVPRLWLRAAPRPLELEYDPDVDPAEPQTVIWQSRPRQPVLGAAGWRCLWAATPFTDDGIQCPRPTQPVELFRAGSPNGWSWTDDRRQAVLIAHAFGRRETPDPLWTTSAPPAALCAWVPLAVHEGTGQATADEAVVDPERLGPVRQWTPAEVDAVRPLSSSITATGEYRVLL